MTIKFTKLRLFITLNLIFVMIASPAYAKHILIYGDSLSAAYGMQENQGWVYLLNEALSENHQVSNASISGETSAGGLARLPLTLDTFSPNIVVIALGANDGLRGYPTDVLEKNLIKMITLVNEAGATAVVAGISIPPSYGPRYIDQFRAVFPKVANANNAHFFDLFRERFFTTKGYIQQDGLHPTPITQPVIRDIVKGFLIDEQLINAAQTD